MGLVSAGEDKDESERKRQNKDMRETLKIKWIDLVPLQTVFQFSYFIFLTRNPSSRFIYIHDNLYGGRPDKYEQWFFPNKITFICVKCPVIGHALNSWPHPWLAGEQFHIKIAILRWDTLTGEIWMHHLLVCLFTVVCTENIASLSL